MSISDSLNFKEYSRDFKSHTNSKSLEDVRIQIFKLVVNNFLHPLSTKHNILNIGSGPVESASLFVSTFLPFSNKIVLCEPNSHYIEDYKTSAWYRANSNKILIVNEPIETYIQENKKSKSRLQFSFIWMNHALYYLRLRYIETFLHEIYTMLTPSNGHCIISIVNKDDPFVTHMWKKLKPTYQLNEYFEKCLNDCYKTYNHKFLWSKVLNSLKMEMSKKDAFDMLYMLSMQDLYSNQDYHPSGIITEKDKKNVKTIIENGLPMLLKKNNHSKDLDSVILCGLTDFYIITKKKMSKM